MAEVAYEREQIEQEIAIARMEAAQEVIPKSLEESLAMHKALRARFDLLADGFEKINSPKQRTKERAIGFALGVLASLLAAMIWWLATNQWPALK